MARTPFDTRQDQDAALNPGELHAAEQFSSHYAQSGIDQAEAFANDKANRKDETDNTRNIDDAKRQETTSNPMNSSFGSNPKKQRQSFTAKLRSNKKKISIWGGLGGGLGALMIAAFMAMMPLKLVGLIENMTTAAAQVPSYAVEQRTEYLVTRALATRMMMLSNGVDNSKGSVAFCANGIACSLFRTYTSSYFEKKMDLSMIKRTNGRVEVRINGDNRDRLGSKARSWTIQTDAIMDESGIRKTINNIEVESNKEMKAYIKERVNNNMHTSSAISRLFARNILMKKYGVTHWRAFEKTQKNLSDVKASFKAGVFKNTIGKVAPRAAVYMACLSGGAGCEKLLKDYSTQVAANPDDTESQAKSKEKMRNTIDATRASMSGVATDSEAAGGVMSKFISNRILTSVVGAVGIASVADLFFSAISSISDGAVEEISYDMMKTTTLGFAVGSDTGILTNADRIKAGDIDPQVLEAIMPMFENVEESAVFAQQNGLNVAADSDNRITLTCQGENGPAATKLAPGQLVCPEYQIVKDVSGTLTSNPAWETADAVSKVWMNTLHIPFALAGEAIGKILSSIPGYDDFMAQVGKLFMPTLSWLIGLIIDVPPVGPEATGAQNYDALGGGVAVSQNIIMEEGAELSGGGGTVLSDKQVATIQQEATQANQDYYNRQSVIAKVFSPSLSGSFTQRFIASMPTTLSGTLKTPATLGRSLIATTSAATMTSNPYNLPIYGYAANSSVLTANPNDYTEESCAASAQARAESYGKHDGQLVATYAVADPCALEKMVVGMMLDEAGVKDNPYIPNLEEPINSTIDGNGSDDSGWGSDGEGNDVTLENSGNKIISSGKWAGWTWPSKPGSACGFSCYRNHIGMDITSASVGDPFYAMHDGVVTLAGEDDVMTAAICNRNASGAIFKPPQITIYIVHTGEDGVKYRVRYSHIKPGTLRVKVGDRVKAGDYIAQTGNSGCTTGPHAHVDVKTKGGARGGVYIDPTTIVGRNGRDY